MEAVVETTLVILFSLTSGNEILNSEISENITKEHLNNRKDYTIILFSVFAFMYIVLYAEYFIV